MKETKLVMRINVYSNRNENINGVRSGWCPQGQAGVRTRVQTEPRFTETCETRKHKKNSGKETELEAGDLSPVRLAIGSSERTEDFSYFIYCISFVVALQERSINVSATVFKLFDLATIDCRLRRSTSMPVCRIHIH